MLESADLALNSSRIFDVNAALFGIESSAEAMTPSSSDLDTNATSDSRGAPYAGDDD